MAGVSLQEQGATKEIIPPHFSVKEAVFPFVKFPGVDTVLGPEMKSTGEVMGVGETFGEAFDKSQLGAGAVIPQKGKVFISVRDADKATAVEVATYLANKGFTILATKGTAELIQQSGVTVTEVKKVKEGQPHIVDLIINGEVDLIVNTTSGKQSLKDSYTIRRQALVHSVTYYTTIAAAKAACAAHESMSGDKTVRRLQDLTIV